MQQIHQVKRKLNRVRVGSSFQRVINSFFDCDIKSQASHYEKIMNSYLAENGPIWTSSRLKAYYDFATRLCLGLDTVNIPFCKTDSSGIPKDLRSMKQLMLSKHIKNRRACLTLLRSYVRIYCDVSKDTTTITEPGSTESAFEEYAPYFDKIIARYKYFLKPYLNDEPMFRTSKKGPNGQALLNLDKDLHAIKREGILETVLLMNEEVQKIRVGIADQEVSLKQEAFPDIGLMVFNSDFLDSDTRPLRKKGVIEHVETMSRFALKFEPNRYDNCISSKISFIAEGGCKTRVIAIGDYFTQDALKPLHRSLYRCLNSLSTDGTSSHNRVSQLVKRKTLNASYVSSYDLTAATDRFPIFIQERVLAGMYNPELARLWRKLMVDRDFTVNDRKIRYSVGQPMGLLSSWAAFALTHHITIEALALKEGFKSFKNYCLIGDDVTIFDKKVSDSYRRFLNHMMVGISEAKSIESKGYPCSAEIAKRFFLNGQEVSPIPVDAIESAIKDYLLVPNLVKLAIERDVVSNNLTTPVQETLCNLHKRRKDKVRVLLSYPWSVPLLRVTPNPWENVDPAIVQEKFDEIRLEYIKRRAQSLYQNELMSIPDMGTLGLVLECEENPDISRHPFMSLLREYRGVCGSIWIGIRTRGLESKDVNLIPYLVNPMVPAYMRRVHQIERVRSSLILKTYKALESIKDE